MKYLKLLILGSLFIQMLSARAQQGACLGVVHEVGCNGVIYNVRYNRSDVRSNGYTKESARGVITIGRVRYVYMGSGGENLNLAIFQSANGDQASCEIASCRF
jgi:hypothetical protein